MNVTLVHTAKTVERNDMPCDRDTRVVPSNAVLGRGPGSPGDGTLDDRNLQFAARPLLASLQTRCDRI